MEEANCFISEIKQKHWDAKHNVYAYILRDGNIKNIRMTASRRERQAYPYWTFSKKRRQRCLRCRNKVLRRHTFGRRRTRQSVFAYRKIALDSGVIVTMAKCDELCVLSDYNYYGKLASLIPENGGTVISADFADNVKVKFSIPCEKSDNIKNLIVDTSNGRFFAEKSARNMPKRKF